MVIRRAFARPTPLPQRLTQAELAAHAEFVATLGAQRVWLDFLREADEAAPRVQDGARA